MPSEYPPPLRPSYLTRRQAAEIFGVASKTIDRWTDAGRLVAAHGDGPRKRGVTTESVEALLAAQDAS